MVDSFVNSCSRTILVFNNISAQKSTIHQVTTMLATSKNVLFPGYNHLLTTSSDDNLLLAGTQEIIKAKGHQYQWLASCYDLEIGHF